MRLIHAVYCLISTQGRSAALPQPRQYRRRKALELDKQCLVACLTAACSSGSSLGPQKRNVRACVTISASRTFFDTPIYLSSG
jgi:hypothetical protein